MDLYIFSHCYQVKLGNFKGHLILPEKSDLAFENLIFLKNSSFIQIVQIQELISLVFPPSLVSSHCTK